MTINELREKRTKSWEAAKSFLETHRTEKGVLSAEDDATYSRMEKEIEDYGREIQRLERQEAFDAELAKATSKPIVNAPNTATKEKVGRASDEYKNAILDALRSNFRNVSNILSEGTDANGGYLVPEEYDKRLIDVLNEENVMRKLGTTITTSGEHKINIAGAKPAATWVNEGAALTFGDATFDQIILDAHKLHVAIKVTDELLYDNAFNLEGYILEQFGKALANAEEDAFINGTGTNQPLGILAKTGGAQVGITAASTTKITADELIDLVYSLKRPYRKNAKFLTNDQTLAVIRKLKDSTGQYLWQPSYQAGEPDRILGYPVLTSAYFPVITADKTAFAFGDFSYYNIGDRGTRSFAELKELFAGNGMVGFLAKERVDGKLVLPEAVKLLNMAKS